MPETENSDIQSRIGDAVAGNDIILFMKGTPDFPQCGFSSVCAQILDVMGVPYVSVNVLESDEIRAGIKTFSDWPTIPQLYIKGEFIGGSDIVREMYESGELQDFYAEKGLTKVDPPS